MASSSDFIKRYGDVSFEEMPFCDADNFALCQTFYMPIEKVAPNSFDGEPMAFDEVCRRMYEYNGNKHVAVGLVLLKGISVKLMNMGESKRYSAMKVTGCREVFETEPALQFGAVTYILPDGTNVVVFRGTDDTIIGWKEDLDLYVRKGIPSQKLATDYLNEVGEKLEGDIIVCGHSKGGNLALYAALSCNEKVRSRIKALYNNDGPGFLDGSFEDSEEYKNLRSVYKHFLPNASFVGVLLNYDSDYTVVKSSRHIIGFLQHDLGTWQVDGGDAETEDDLSMFGRINDLALKKIIYSVDDEHSQIFDSVANLIIKGTGQLTLTGFVKNIGSSIKGGAEAWKAVDEDVKDTFRTTFSGAGSMLVDAIKTVRSTAAPMVKAAAAKVAEKAMA